MTSVEQRMTRAEHIAAMSAPPKYHYGQTVVHKLTGLRGVVDHVKRQFYAENLYQVAWLTEQDDLDLYPEDVLAADGEVFA